MALDKSELKSLRHPTEISRFYITLLILLPLGILIAVVTIATFGLILIYAPLILFFVWFATRLAAAHYMNNMVLVSDKSFPEIFRTVSEAKELFGYPGEIQCFVYEQGEYNAAMMYLLRRKVILINSETLNSNEKDGEIRFIVGRFVGALASKHFRFGWLQAYINAVERLLIFNILLFPYERSIQYSGDQLGLYFIGGKVDVASRALLKMVVGQALAKDVNLGGFIEQSIISRGSFFVWLTRAFARFPHLSYRVVNIFRFGLERFPDQTMEHIAALDEDSKVVIRLATK